MKRYLWLACVSCFLYFTYLFDFSAGLHGVSLLFGDWHLGPGNITAVYVTVLMAVLCAVQGFGFLFSEKKTNFYFGLPIKRSLLFWSNYLCGFLVSILPCIAGRVLCFLVQEQHGLTAVKTMQNGILVNAAGFLFIYTILLIVIFVVGKLFTAVIGMGLAFAYGVFVIGFVIEKYSVLFFHTFYQSDMIDKLKVYLSPVELYKKFAGVEEAVGTSGYLDIGDWSLASHLSLFCFIIIVTVLAVLLSVFLFKRRPAEGAGKVIVFAKMKTIIKIVLAIPLALTAGYYMALCFGNGTSLPFLAAGILLGAFVVNGIMEVIYQADIRALRSNILHALAVAGISGVIAAGFYMDLPGYDSYVPSKDDIEKIGVSIKGINDSYYLDEEETQDLNAAGQLSAMSIKGKTKSDILKWIRSINVNQDEKTAYTQVTVAYKKSSENIIYRKYILTSQEQLESFEKIYASQEYKEAADSLAGCRNLRNMNFAWTNGIRQYSLDLTSKENEELLQCYKADILEQKLEDLESEMPISILSLEYEGNGVGAKGCIYPSYQRTNAYLKTLGIPADQTVGDYNISQIKIRNGQGMKDGESQIVDDPEEIKNMKERLVYADCVVNPVLYPVEKSEVTVKYTDENGFSFGYINCRLFTKS